MFFCSMVCFFFLKVKKKVYLLFLGVPPNLHKCTDFDFKNFFLAKLRFFCVLFLTLCILCIEPMHRLVQKKKSKFGKIKSWNFFFVLQYIFINFKVPPKTKDRPFFLLLKKKTYHRIKKHTIGFLTFFLNSLFFYFCFIFFRTFEKKLKILCIVFFISRRFWGTPQKQKIWIFFTIEKKKHTIEWKNIA
jgi:hypothetical protein